MDHASVYPPGPTNVPAGFTRPTAAYQRHAYLAVAALVVFLAGYFALTAWFGWTSWRLVNAAMHARKYEIWLGLAGLAAGLLTIFMLKALIFVRRSSTRGDLEITAASHPRLVGFLHQLADEAGAPRPRKIYLSPTVNAGVFYDLTLLSLVLPTRKNLVIGLGLVNVLTLSELKAVLAHEFGHFAQRSMRVGRWVYTAQQVAGHLVHKRDWLDGALRGLSQIDLRVAWIGWILRGIVWAIRAVVDTLFRGVQALERALSREMELQADLVAVSLTGSDALVHALAKATPADDAFDRALAFATRDEPVADLFAVQTWILDRKREIIGDPHWGAVPPMPADATQHRVFAARIAHPPRMWSTHPPSEVREANAKRVYLPVALDDRSAWSLFEDPAAVRAAVTRDFYQRAADALAKEGSDQAAHVRKLATGTPMDPEAMLAQLHDRFRRPSFDAMYRGRYLARPVTQHARTFAELVELDAPVGSARETAALYPATLVDELAKVDELTEQIDAIEAIAAGRADAGGRFVSIAGVLHRRRELPVLLAQLKVTRAAAERTIIDGDRRIRSLHLATARQLGGGWEAAYRGHLELVHYLEHSEADLDDAAGAFGNVFAVVTADGHVSGSERTRLLLAASDVYTVLEQIYAGADKVRLPAALRAHTKGEDFAAALGEFKFPPPSEANLGPWIGGLGSWLRGTSGPLAGFAAQARDALLELEDELLAMARGAQPVGEAPYPPQVPARYGVLVPGSERPRQTQLGLWDRFQLADGIGPGVLRLAAAGAIVGGVLLAGRAVGGEAEVYLYNGLGRPVRVMLDGKQVTLDPYTSSQVTVNAGEFAVAAATVDGTLIERFTADAGEAYTRYIYNVAQAAPLRQWSLSTPNDGVLLGAPRWRQSAVTRFEDHPGETIRGGQGDVVVGAIVQDDGPALPSDLDAAARTAIVEAHAVWEPATVPGALGWIEEVSDDRITAVLAQRRKAQPGDVATERAAQDTDTSGTVCAAHVAAATTAVGDAVAQYLAVRCMHDGPAQDAAFAALAARFPTDGWSAMAAGMAASANQRWAEAQPLLARAVHRLPPGVAARAAEEFVRARAALGRDATTGAAPGDRELAALSRDVAMAQRLDGHEPANEVERYIIGLASGWSQTMPANLSATDRIVVTLLAGASDGANANAVAAARAIPATELHGAYLLVAWGLARHAGADDAALLAQLDEFGPMAADMRQFLDRVRPGVEASVADSLSPMFAELRGWLMVAATVALGAQTPPAWRALAIALSFPHTRPFLMAPVEIAPAPPVTPPRASGKSRQRAP